MAETDDRFPVRKNPRIPNYDYSTPGYYFVTICTAGKRCIFGAPGELNRYGHIARQCLADISAHFSGVTVDQSVVMPNHIHIILVLHQAGAALCAIVGQYKSAVTKRIHRIDPGLEVWQTSFHDHIIRNEQDYQRIWSYIDANPARWKDDCFFEE